MNITKYGISEYCGYGFFVRGSYLSSDRFYTSIRIYARSEITTETAYNLKWTEFSENNRGPFCVVFDSDTGTWKEYFSGMTVNLAADFPDINHTVRGGFDVDIMPNYCDVLSISTPRECLATEFAERVSLYSDKEIKKIVARLNTLSNNASEWKSKFDAMVKAVKDERAAKEAGLFRVESKLASGFGEYGNNSSGGTQEEKLQWIRQGRCAFCGGEFKGLFSKVCRECGKAKDYR